MPSNQVVPRALSSCVEERAFLFGIKKRKTRTIIARIPKKKVYKKYKRQIVQKKNQ